MKLSESIDMVRQWMGENDVVLSTLAYNALCGILAVTRTSVAPYDGLEADGAPIASKTIDVPRPAMPEEKPTGQVYGIIDPDYGRIYTMVRKLAWEEGYAIGLHGSFTRDLDLIAVPWEAGRNCKPEKLVARILQATGMTIARTGNPGEKPFGRLAWTLLLPEFGDPRFVDLSIMPTTVVREFGDAVIKNMELVLARLEQIIEAAEIADCDLMEESAKEALPCARAVLLALKP